MTATYAIATGTSLGRGVEIVKGAITGAAPKVNKLREISEQELQHCEQHSYILTSFVIVFHDFIVLLENL